MCRISAEKMDGVGYIFECIVIRAVGKQDGDCVLVSNDFEENVGYKPSIGYSEIEFANTGRIWCTGDFVAGVNEQDGKQECSG